MTKQEAIEILLEMAFAERTEFAEDRLFAFGYSKEHEALQIAIECIEKQIPKKPIIEYLPLFKAYCPVCEGRLLPSKWCAKCGQAIDWSDNE